MREALPLFVDYLERCQIRLYGVVPPVAAREIAKMRQLLAADNATEQHPPTHSPRPNHSGSIHPPT